MSSDLHVGNKLTELLLDSQYDANTICSSEGCCAYGCCAIYVVITELIIIGRLLL